MKLIIILSLALVALGAPQFSRPSFPTGPRRGSGSCSSGGLSNLTQPVASPSLPAPPTGNVLAAIVVGRGVQNYTCATNSTYAPVALGAVATLYEASDAAVANPSILKTISQDAFNFPMIPGGPAPPALVVKSGFLRRAGQHFFTAAGVPAFDLTGDGSLGLAMVTKAAASPAPAGSNAVAWLKLLKTTGTTGAVTAIYRLSTVGGVPPATCAGQPAVISVQYAAQYWVYTPPA